MWIKWTKKKPEKIETNILKRLPWSKPQIDSADDMIRSSSVSWGTCIRHLRRILFLAREKKWIWMSQLRPETQRPSFFHKMATSTDSLSEGRKKDACEIPPDKGIPGIPDLCSKHECRQDDFCDRLVSRRVNRRQREESRGILPKTCANRISCWQRRKVRKTCKRELNSHEALKNNFARGNRHVKTYALDVHTETLYTYPDPVSPHIATDKVRSSRTIIGEMGMEE